MKNTGYLLTRDVCLLFTGTFLKFENYVLNLKISHIATIDCTIKKCKPTNKVEQNESDVYISLYRKSSTECLSYFV